MAGTGRRGEHLYPAMPNTYFTRMTREDALAIRAQLASVSPVTSAAIPNQFLFFFRN